MHPPGYNTIIISINFLFFWVKNMAKRDNEEVIFASLNLDVSKRAAIKCFLNTEWPV